MLLLDNRDSFVWNLAQAFEVLGREVCVVRSDEVTIKEIRAREPAALVLSPGPGRPEDAGICVSAIRALSGEMPILGICLGFQAIAEAFGGKICRGRPCHGKPWDITHGGSGLLEGLPDPFPACRYHSLTVDPEHLPAELIADAWTPEGVLMSLRHTEDPTFGLQFHPESFHTEYGPTILKNFLRTMP